VSPDLPLLADYPATAADEVVDAAGRLRDTAAVLRPLLDRPDLRALAAAATSAFGACGGEVAVRRDGRPAVHAVPLDPVPRLLERADWDVLAAGVAQRHRALDAFLADVYRASGRRRGDPDRAPEIVRSGALPEWAVVGSPGHTPAAVGMAWPAQRRIALLGCDVVRAADGRWLVRADQTRVPGGLALALAARRGITVGAPALLPPPSRIDPADAVPLLRSALQAAAPPACAESAALAVLRSTDPHLAPGEEIALAAALDVPLVGPGDLWPRVDGGVAVSVDGRRTPVDVLHLRLDDAEMAAHRTPAGQTVGALLGEAVRAGRLGLANVPGNALADDPTLFAAVPAMIRFYLGEEPLLEQVPTWVLADDEQWAHARDRLHELVVVPVAAYGGGRPVRGPECSAAELAELQVEVAAAPHRFIARACVPLTTSPTLVGGRLLPRAVDLRIFSASDRGSVRVLEAPLSRVTTGESGSEVGAPAAVKDTWLSS
jgi:carboxylate-amine ligase